MMRTSNDESTAIHYLSACCFCRLQLQRSEKICRWREWKLMSLYLVRLETGFTRNRFRQMCSGCLRGSIAAFKERIRVKNCELADSCDAIQNTGSPGGKYISRSNTSDVGCQLHSGTWTTWRERFREYSSTDI